MHKHAIQRAPDHRLGQEENVGVAGRAGTCRGGVGEGEGDKQC